MGAFSNNKNFTYITRADDLDASSDSKDVTYVSDTSFINPEESNPTETTNLDLEQPIETVSLDTDESDNVSFNEQEYLEFLEKVYEYYDEKIDLFHAIIFGDEENEGLKALYEQYYYDFTNTDFTDVGAYLASRENIGIYADNINNLLFSKESDINPEEFFNNTGYSFEDFMNLDMDQKIEIIEQNPSFFVTNYNTVLMEHIQNYKENVEINTSTDIAFFFQKYPFLVDYEDAKNYLEELNTSILSCLEMIRIFEDRKKTAYYDYLDCTTDFQNFQSDIMTPFTDADVEQYREYLSNYAYEHEQSGNITFNYDDFSEHFPGVSPMEFMKILNYIYRDPSNYIMEKCDFEYSTYSTLLEACKNNPDYVTKYDYLYHTYGLEAAEKFAQDTLDEAHRIVGEYEANQALSLLLESEGNNDFLAFNLNSFVVSNIAGLHGFADAFYGFSYAAEMVGNVLGITEQNRVKSAIDYKRLYLTYALMDHNDKVNNGLIQYDEATGEFVNTDPDLFIIDFTRDYPGFKLNWEYTGLKMFGRYLPFMLLSIKFPTAAQIMAGLSSAGRTYHEKMTNGEDFTESVIFSTLQGISYPIVGHFLKQIPIFLQQNDTSSLIAFLKTFVKNIPKWAIKGGLNFLSRNLTTQINELIANYESTGNLSMDKVNELINLIAQEIPEFN